MSEETTATGTEAQMGDPVTKIVSGGSVYPIRDAGALRDGEGTVSGTNLADGSVDHSKLAADVADDIQELEDGMQALRDSVSRDISAIGFKRLAANGGLTSVPGDTYRHWMGLGSGYCLVSASVTASQPYQYGFMLSLVQGNMVCQLFMAMGASGGASMRSHSINGDGDQAMPAWRKVG
ncbi:hypothetical protein AAK967_00565 [Atopobiaceae bacterium 24-176]